MVGTLDLYRIFHTVCQNNSFSKAAQALYMTQSAVSQSILKLEKELEIQLFLRTPKGVVLTHEGSLLYEYVSSSLGLIATAEEKLQAIKQLQTGELRIGVGDTISRYFLLPYLEHFHFKFPGIKLNILNGTTSEISAFLKSGKADLGIINLPIKDDQLQIVPCKVVQDIFVCGKKYIRLTKQPIRYEELMKLPLIFLEKKANSRMYVENFLKKKGYTLSPAFELGTYDLVLEFTKINLGISCVIKEFSQEYLERGDIYELELEEAIPKRHIGICYLKNVSLSNAAQNFIDSIRKNEM